MIKSDNLIYLLYSDSKTVFKFIDVAMLTGETNFVSLKLKLNYYVRTGRLLNVRKGIYCKSQYNKEELACRVFSPAYISLDYVLQKEGVVFQYDTRVTAVSYLSREIKIENQVFNFRKLKNILLASQEGIEQFNNGVAIATVERAFLDTLYLNGEFYFDNLRPLNEKKVEELLPIYKSKALINRVKKIFDNGHK
jgi:hypothetical protein